MTASTGKPVLFPAVAFCVALAAAAAGGAWAGEEPVVPFPGTSVPGASVPGTSVPGTSVPGASVPGTSVPGTSVPGTSVPGTSVPGAVADGGGTTAEALLPPLGAAAASPAAGPTVPGAAAADEAAAPDAGADVPGTSGPAVDAEPSDAVVPDGAMAAAKPATPAGGSRLLRALAEAPKAPASLDDRAAGGVPGDVARPGTPRVFAAEGCPRALLRRLLAGAAGEADALSALGIEREILALCRERQEILAGLFETEARLSELRDAGRAPEPQTPVTAASAAPAPEANTPVVETAARSPLRAALGGAAEQAKEADTRAADTRAADPRAADPRAADARAGDTRAGEPQGNSLVRAPARVSPRYAWFSIIGTAGRAPRGRHRRGRRVVRARGRSAAGRRDDRFAIAGRPPGVRVTGAGESGEAALLPFRARPGGGP